MDEFNDVIFVKITMAIVNYGGHFKKMSHNLHSLKLTMCNIFNLNTRNVSLHYNKSIFRVVRV